ncbi:Synaptogyrin-1, partial [Goodea atripinnis]
FWSLIWFVGFCFLANQWQISKPEDNPLNEGADAARATIIFCFFSIFTWVCSCTESACCHLLVRQGYYGFHPNHQGGTCYL